MGIMTKKFHNCSECNNNCQYVLGNGLCGEEKNRDQEFCEKHTGKMLGS